MTFDQLIQEIEHDYGRINFAERIMLRRAYDVIPEKEEQDRICHKTEKWDSEHRYLIYRLLSSEYWRVQESEDGSYPKCPCIKWFKTKEDIKYYARNNGLILEDNL